MNRTRYRIVFNRARGVLMAVAEHASAQGKSPGATPGDMPVAASAGIGAHPALQAFASTLASALVTLCLTLGNLPAAQAQIIADLSAPANQRPTVLQDSAGRPLVNIQTPSAAGVSRNTYSRFDVQSNGAVLNNARTSNPWLAGGEAKVILNEVKSANPSYLGGAITVNGTRAQVVIANPAGIKVDGASFVNASRATLTTGTPVIGANGALTGLDVRQGTVEVTAKGLNVRAVSYTDILSRAASIAGRIDANAADELNITTGAQTVDYATGQLSAGTATGTKPTVAIDTAALGGMYAGKITLLATEAGTGVRNAGTLKADTITGQLIVTADGRLENTGIISGPITSVATVKDNIDNSGTLQGTKVLMVSAGADLNHSGAGLKQIPGLSSVVLHARRDINLASGASISSGGFRNNAGVITEGTVALQAGRDISLASGSRVETWGLLRLESNGQINATGASISSKAGEVTALAAQGITLTNTSATGKTVHLETGAPFVETSADIRITGGSIKGTQQTAAIATGHLALSSPGSTALSSDGDVYLRAAKNLTVSAGTASTAGRHYTAMAGEALSLQGVAGSTATNGLKVSLAATGDLTLTGGAVSLSGSQLTANGALRIEATKTNVTMSALAHAGGSAHERVQLSAGQDLAVSAYQGGIFATGLLASGHKVSLLSQGLLSIRHVDNKLAAGGLQALGSDITARQDLTVGSVGASQPLVILASSLAAAGKLTLSSQGPVLLLSAVNLQPKADGGMASTSATTQLKGQHVAVQGGSVVLQGTQAQATAGHLGVTATQGDVELAAAPGGTRADLSATGNAALHAHGQLRLSQADLKAGGALGLTAATGGITSTSMNLTAGDMLSASSKGAQTHTGGVYQGGALSIYNETGTQALNTMQLTTGTTRSASASAFSGQLSLESGGAMTVDVATRFEPRSGLSIVTGLGDITIVPYVSTLRPAGLVLRADQVDSEYRLTLVARNGDLTLAGAHGSNGLSSVESVNMWSRHLTLSGNNVTFQGGEFRGLDFLDVVATTGKIVVNSNYYTLVENGSTNRYWVQTVLGGGDVRSGSWGTAMSLTGSASLRAAGNIEINGALVDAREQLSLKSGGNITVAGVFNDWSLEASGLYMHRSDVLASVLSGFTGLSVEALGGHLVLNASTASSQQGLVRLQALGDINLEAAQEHELDDRTTREVRRNSYGKKKVKTTNVHNESLVTYASVVTGRSVDIKAGSNVNTYAAQLGADESLRIEAGDQANYYGIHDQIELRTTTTKTSSLFGIKYSKTKDTNSRMELIGKPAVLVSQGTIHS
jgi:filamentous hemagglutinin